MLFTETELRARARARPSYSAKKSEQVLAESRDSRAESFDVFLSHSIIDAELIEGAKAELERQGLAVYVDWKTDRLLDRTQVTEKTAAHLRRRMHQCKMLVYVHTLNASFSKWCPWELGYFDGLRGGNVFIFPVAAGVQYDFKGQEYLGLYPYLYPTSDNQKVLIKEAQAAAFVEAAVSRTYVRKPAES